MKPTAVATVALAAVLACTTCIRPSRADDDTERWNSDGNAGYLVLGLGLMEFSNDPVASRMAPNPPVQDGALNLGAEVGVFILRSVSMALRYQYHSSKYHSGGDWNVFGHAAPTYKTRINDALVDVRAWFPPRGGGLAGVAGGVSKGYLEEKSQEGRSWSAGGIVFQVYAGGQFMLGDGDGTIVLGRAGYTWRDFGTVDESFFGDPTDRTSLDMSGWFMELAIGGITEFGKGE